jgi:hypothetical protein
VPTFSPAREGGGKLTDYGLNVVGTCTPKRTIVSDRLCPLSPKGGDR